MLIQTLKKSNNIIHFPVRTDGREKSARKFGGARTRWDEAEVVKFMPEIFEIGEELCYCEVPLLEIEQLFLNVSN